MSLDLTDVSAREYETIIYGNMSPKMAAEYLRQKRVCVRSFSQTLEQMYQGEDLLDRLVAFYQLLQPQIKQASIRKKIKNWLHERNGPKSREDFFCIAFALHLREVELNFLLGICTDYAIQYRDAREAVLAWFLRTGKTYKEALSFLKDLPVVPKGTATFSSLLEELHPAETMCDDHMFTFMLSRAEMEALEESKRDVANITRVIYQEFFQVQTLEELRVCYLRNIDRFGKMHLRAYYYFEQYMEMLIKPVAPLNQKEPDYSIDTIMNKYLLLHMPSGRRRANFSVVQRLIKENWPNATALKNIRNHLDDVPRKLLLLLYVITENSDSWEDYRETDEGYVSIEERVEDHWWTLNGMLSESGMAPLDLRNAFDWLILYAICTDGEEAMRDRLEGVINELFKDAVL
ncbi:MAG: hypothetical protein Q4D81_02755 [Eubacteriales bacterium]|nr:hypothetical protein [Eubacteriales bacterium]